MTTTAAGESDELSHERRNVILLGASNLTIAWRQIVSLLQQGLAEPVNLFVALGMGRSYVNWSRFMFRQLPGISCCQLFEDLRSLHQSSVSHRVALPNELATFEPGLSPLVLITDVGNDLVYGRLPEAVISAVDSCAENIRRWKPQSRILITTLPLHSIQRLSKLRFLVARTILFPGSQLTLPVIAERAEELDRLVRQLAERHQMKIVEPLDHWYGLDPIHVRSHLRTEAFRYIFENWSEFSAAEVQRDVIAAAPALPKVVERIVWGRRQSTEQPCFLADRLSVFGY